MQEKAVCKARLACANVRNMVCESTSINRLRRNRKVQFAVLYSANETVALSYIGAMPDSGLTGL